MNKIIWIVGAACVLVVLGSFFVVSKDKTTVDAAPDVDALSEQSVAVSPQEAQAGEARGAVQELTAKQFAALVADYGTAPQTYIGTKPCVVDFYATWCGPCKKLAPVMEKMAGRYAGRVLFYKVDIDQVPELAQAYGIQSIPTLLFCSGKGVEAMVGAPAEAELEQLLNGLK